MESSRKTNSMLFSAALKPRNNWLRVLVVAICLLGVANSAIKASAATFVDAFNNGANWQIVRNGGNGVLFNGVLNTSYGWGEAARTITVAQPSTVTLQVDIFAGDANTIGSPVPTADSYLVTVGTTTLQNTAIHGWQTVTLTYETQTPNEPVLIRLAGIDNGFWGGWYGPKFDNAIVTVAETPTPLPSNAVWAYAPEGWDMTLTAPDGGIFSEIVFASYGTPQGQDGYFTQGQCHATNSVEIVSGLVVGQSSATVPASNGLFGDPCGGTYKALAVVALYVPAATTTTSTTTTTTTSTTTTSTTTTTTTSTTTTVPPTTTTSVMPETTVTTTSTTTLPETTVPETTMPPVAIPTTTTGGRPELPQVATTQTSTTTTSTTTILPEPTTTTTSTTVPAAAIVSELLNATREPDATVELKELTAVLQPEVLEQLSEEQVEQVVDAIVANADELSPEEQEVLSQTLSAAPESVKKAFEQKANVFGGAFDGYVPTGSNISVRERRVLIAATAAIFAVPAAAPSRKNI